MKKLMIEKNGRRRFRKSREIEDFEIGASSHDQTKTRLNVTVLPKTSNWLKGRGNASHTIDELVEAAIAGDLKPEDNPSQQLAELIRENSELKAELNQLQSQLQKESEKRLDYQVIRAQVLNSLRLGKQAPGYKSAVKALNRFIAEIH
jgi:vacuolar-type H+-ATPase subunit I/STV1